MKNKKNKLQISKQNINKKKKIRKKKKKKKRIY